MYPVESRDMIIQKAQTASDFLPVSDYYWVFRPLALTARVIRLGGAAL
jgi:hypothetical protein